MSSARSQTVMNSLSSSDIPTVSLELCQYNPQYRILSLASDHVGMPQQLIIRSHRTGKEVRFVVVGPEDKLFDQDQWDGEQQVYRPVGHVPTVSYLVIQRPF